VGEMLSGIQAADAAVIFVNAVNSVEFHTSILFDRAKSLQKPIAFLVNKLDSEQIDFDKIQNELVGSFGGKQY